MACALSPRQVPAPRVEHDAHNSCSMHNTHGRTAAITLEESSKNKSSRQRRPNSKKPLGKKNSSSLHLISSQRSDVTLKIPDERTIKISRNSSKESSPKHCAEQSNTEKTSIISQLSESFLLDSRTSHSSSGIELGLTRSIQIATKADTTAVAIPEQPSHEVSKECPFDQPGKPKDYKSREDRLLTPGLTQMDREKSLQDAVMKSEPPMNLVLHECSTETITAVPTAGLPFYSSRTVDPSVLLQPSFELYTIFIYLYTKFLPNLNSSAEHRL
ncbi:uncharacterized protein [Physcomitrium patens]|uniref:uncharacterized protein isoform X1 n=1 Tax=Physcomitrium patens TaxID=3218 RepID=UPI003CCC9255